MNWENICRWKILERTLGWIAASQRIERREVDIVEMCKCQSPPNSSQLPAEVMNLWWIGGCGGDGSNEKETAGKREHCSNHLLPSAVVQLQLLRKWWCQWFFEDSCFYQKSEAGLLWNIPFNSRIGPASSYHVIFIHQSEKMNQWKPVPCWNFAHKLFLISFFVIFCTKRGHDGRVNFV